MWPWAHAATGYLLYRLWVHYRRQEIDDVSALVLGLGTFLPDLIDKPLAWTFGVLTSGRSLSHSLLVVGLVFAVAWLLLDAKRSRTLLAVGTFGVLTHILGDALPLMVSGEWIEVGFLFWPVLRPSGPDEMASFLEHLLAIGPTPFFIFQTLLTLVALLVWFRDGQPGLDLVLSPLRERP